MSEIDFLANQKPADGQEPKNQDDKKEKIIWSKPEGDKPIAKEVPFSSLSFFKNKEVEKPAPAAEPAIDKNKIRESRREILKLIKHNESLELNKEKKPDKGFWASLIEKFKKQPSHQEVLVDYQQVFNQEKIKRGSAADQLSASKFNSPAARPSSSRERGVEESLPKPSSRNRAGLSARLAEAPAKRVGQANLAKSAFNARPAVEEKPAAVKPARFAEVLPGRPAFRQRAKEPRDSFFSRFLKMIKDKIAALSRPKLRPVKASSVEIIKETKPEIAKLEQTKPARFADPRSAGGFGEARVAAEVEPVKRAGEEKREIKIKEKPLEQAEPAQIKTEAPKVLETNLIEGEIITFFDWHKKIAILIGAILIPIFFITVIYFGLMYYQKQNQVAIQEQVKKLNELTGKIKQEEAGLKEITDFQSRLKLVSQIFAKHIYWTNLFKFLEDNTIKNIYYAGFSGDTSGNYSLAASASKFGDISQQIDILRNNQKITDVKTTGGESVPGDASNNNKVKFNFNFSILKDIFYE